jgi:hypothetical protein
MTLSGVPVTVYRDTIGLAEYSNAGANNIVDTVGNNLVDTLGNQIVDTGVVRTMIPATTWAENNAI